MGQEIDSKRLLTFAWGHLLLWKRTGVDCFFLADGREPQNHLKQIAVSSQLHGAVLQFGQALWYRQAQTVAFASFWSCRPERSAPAARQ